MSEAGGCLPGLDLRLYRVGRPRSQAYNDSEWKSLSSMRSHGVIPCSHEELLLGPRTG